MGVYGGWVMTDKGWVLHSENVRTEDDESDEQLKLDLDIEDGR